MLVLLVDDCPVPASGDNLRARVIAATEALTPA